MIQAMYLSQSDSFDIFAANAMLFSVLSIMIGVFQQVSRIFKMKDSSIAAYNKLPPDSEESATIDTPTGQDNNNNMYKMTINCDKFKQYHIHTSKLIETALCHILGIDDAGQIEVFYSAFMNYNIYVYLQLSSKSVASFDSINQRMLKSNFEKIGIEGDDRNEMFKQEIIDGLKIRVGKKRIQVSDLEGQRQSQIQPGAQTFKLVSKMSVTIEEMSAKMTQQIN